MKQLSSNQAKQITNKELMKSVRSMIQTANRINIESNSENNDNNVKFFLTGDANGIIGNRVDHNFKLDNKGGFKSTIAVSRANKEQLRKMYNDLVGYINSDVDSSLYNERQKIGKEKFIKYINDNEQINPGITITDEDAELMFDLKDSMPELFDSSSTFYELVVIACAEYRQENGQFSRSLVNIAMQEKKKLIKSGKEYTMDDLKKNIISNIERGSTKPEYTSAKKKDRKSARLKRKAKRNKRG